MSSPAGRPTAELQHCSVAVWGLITEASCRASGIRTEIQEEGAGLLLGGRMSLVSSHIESLGFFGFCRSGCLKMSP